MQDRVDEAFMDAITGCSSLSLLAEKDPFSDPFSAIGRRES